MFRIFKMKKYVEFNLATSRTFKYDCITKTREMFSFLPVINNSVTIWLRFLLLTKSTITSSKDINTSRFLSWLSSPTFFQRILILYLFYLGCAHQYFYRHLAYYLNIQISLQIFTTFKLLRFFSIQILNIQINFINNTIIIIIFPFY